MKKLLFTCLAVLFFYCAPKEEKTFKVPKYVAPVFSGDHLWFSNLMFPGAETKDGLFVHADSHKVEILTVVLNSGLHTSIREYVHDPRLTDWWDKSVVMTPLETLKKTVARATRTEDHPEVTAEIIAHMGKVGVLSEINPAATDSAEISKAMYRYDEPAIWMKLGVRARMAGLQ